MSAAAGEVLVEGAAVTGRGLVLSAPISFWRIRTRLPTRTMLMKRTLSEP